MTTTENLKENLVEDEVTNIQLKDEKGFEKETLLDDEVKSKKSLYFFSLFTIGFINNLGYVLVGSSAQNLADHFGETNLMGFFSFCLIACSGLARIFNSKYLINVKHRTRIFAMLLISCCAYVTLGIANMTSEKWGFFVSLIGSVMIGICCSLGESVILGFLKAFPSKLVTGWSSGTGLAGVGGAGIYLGLRSAAFPDQYIFFSLIPLHLVYWLLFYWLNYRKNIYNNPVRSRILSENLNADPNTIEDGKINDGEPPVLKKNPSQEELPPAELIKEEELDAGQNQKLSMSTIKPLLKKIGYYCFNLAFVYFLEYSCTTGFADRAHPKDENEDNFFKKNAYVLLGFCYQFGVLLSRSSLYFFKIKRIGVITTFQVINFILWLFLAINNFLPIYLQFALMVWVGLMGGCSYVNVMYLILEDPFVTNNEKELSMNLCTVFNDTGVLISACFVLLMSNTFMKR